MEVYLLNSVDLWMKWIHSSLYLLMPGLKGNGASDYGGFWFDELALLTPDMDSTPYLEFSIEPGIPPEFYLSWVFNSSLFPLFPVSFTLLPLLLNILKNLFPLFFGVPWSEFCEP